MPRARSGALPQTLFSLRAPPQGEAELLSKRAHSHRGEGGARSAFGWKLNWSGAPRGVLGSGLDTESRGQLRNCFPWKQRSIKRKRRLNATLRPADSVKK